MNNIQAASSKSSGISSMINRCCICNKDCELVKLQHKDTWETLSRAANLRKHALSELHYDEGSELPTLWYHRKCYQIFTLKRDLEKISTRAEFVRSVIDGIDMFESDETEQRQKRDNENASSGIILKKECIFCKKNRYRNKKLLKLTQCLELRAVQAIRNTATALNDFEILSLLQSKDIIAAEAHYHKDCYNTYIKRLTTTTTAPITTIKDPYKVVELDAYKEISKYCFSLEENPQIVKFTDLLYKMEEYIKSKNQEIRKSTRLCLQRNLQKLNIVKFQTISGSIYIYPSSMRMDDLVTMYVELQSKLSKKLAEGSVNVVKAAASSIRSEILQLKDTLPWPPQPEDLQPNKFIIPENLSELLNSIFNQTGKANSRKSRVIYSLAQDIIYTVRNGKVKTPKSILLPTMVKTLTNNTEIINALNRLGHGVSYSTLVESQTENAFCILDQQLASGCIIPKECRTDSFTIYVADNIDRNEQTLSGYGTTHKVNNLLIQNAGDFGQYDVVRSPKRKRGRRSFKPQQTESSSSMYFSSKRIGPSPMEIPENIENPLLYAEQSNQNFVWAFMRWHFRVKQVVPSWTGFNITMHNNMAVLKSSVCYLDCIDSPATDMTTIYQVMERALNIIEKLRLVSIVCVFDQAIYSKACEIKRREAKKFRSCLLMMGVFHLLMMYMGILKKRFSDAGLKDTLIQSSIVAEGSVESALSGKSYNRGIRLYKVAFESLIRLILLETTAQLSPERRKNLSILLEPFEESPNETIFAALDDENLTEIYNMFLDIKKKWEETGSELQKFWLTFIDMVELLLNTIFAVRSGNWHLLMTCINDIIPYSFAYDNFNYARYLTAMFCEMTTLEDDFPEIYDEFVAGNFAAQLSSNGRFSRTETDKVIEMTLNRDTKTPGGTTGFSTNVGAVQRWEINAKYRASLRTVFHQHLNYKQNQYQHKDLTPSRIIKDEKDVSAVVAVLD